MYLSFTYNSLKDFFYVYFFSYWCHLYTCPNFVNLQNHCSVRKAFVNSTVLFYFKQAYSSYLFTGKDQDKYGCDYRRHDSLIAYQKAENKVFERQTEIFGKEHDCKEMFCRVAISLICKLWWTPFPNIYSSCLDTFTLFYCPVD